MRAHLILCAVAGAFALPRYLPLVRNNSIFPALLPIVSGPPPAAGSDQICGGFADLKCPTGLQCRYPIGSCMSTKYQTGTCRQIPDKCLMPGALVCGCDGANYPTSCDAYMGNTNVDHIGRCGEAPSSIVPSVSPPSAPLVAPSRPPPISAPERFAPHPASFVPHRAPKICTSANASKCGANSFCQTEGSCGADDYGVCKTVPKECPDNLIEPVCGCNGITYSTECEIARDKVNIMHRGQCAFIPEADTKPIGPPQAYERCGFNATSQFYQFCADPEANCVNVPDFDGQCYTDDMQFCLVPEHTAFDPNEGEVCGCDGFTYSNRKDAYVWSVSVRNVGPCASVTMNPTTTESGDSSFIDTFVGPSYGPCAGDADCVSSLSVCVSMNSCYGAGSCRRVTPSLCDSIKPQLTEAHVVCGCDGQIYPSACEAVLYGNSSVDFIGRCTAFPDGVSKCQSDADCDSDEFCRYDLQQCYTTSTTPGYCQDKPKASDCQPEPNSTIYCGCDGLIYESECAMQAVGVSKADFMWCSQRDWDWSAMKVTRKRAAELARHRVTKKV